MNDGMEEMVGPWPRRSRLPTRWWTFKLGAMKVGYLVDYDLKTWEVTGYNTYDYSGFETERMGS